MSESVHYIFYRGVCEILVKINPCSRRTWKIFTKEENEHKGVTHIK
jgi:hypothetical protein